MLLELRVVPNAKRFSIISKDGMLKVHVRSKAEDGKANAELVQELEKALGCRVRVLHGAKSRRKSIELECEERTVLGLIAKLGATSAELKDITGSLGARQGKR